MRWMIAVLLALPMAALAEEAAEREITGQLTYMARIALPDSALVTVEARGLRDVVLGQVTFETGGAQVPLPFALTVPAGAAVRLTATVGAEGGPQWAAGPVAVAGDATEVGDILLQPGGLPYRLLCGDVPVTARFDGTGMEILTPRGDLRLVPEAAASGARFAAEGDPTTWFWSKGDVATLSIFGEELPECGLRPATYVARGNEPFWTFSVTGDAFTLTTPEGEEASGALPQAAWREGAVEWDIADQGLRLRMEEAVCRDDMTGMPYPETVTLLSPDGARAGCGGDPVSLLDGGEWVIEDIAGGGIIDGAHLTIAFREGGAVGGTGGCNRYSAGFTLSGEGLTIGPAASTMMACAEALMQLEQALFAALPEVTRFDIDETGALELYGAGAEPLVTARR